MPRALNWTAPLLAIMVAGLAVRRYALLGLNLFVVANAVAGWVWVVAGRLARATRRKPEAEPTRAVRRSPATHSRSSTTS